MGIAMPEVKVGTVTHFFNHISVATIKLEGELKVGDMLLIKGAHDDISFKLSSMQVNHADVPSAPKGAEVGVKLPTRAHEGSVVYVVRP